MGIIHGKKLMLFIKEGTGSTAVYKSIGYATNHTFSTSASTVDVAHKDLADAASGAGKWDNQDIDTYSWTITTENFYASEADGYTFNDLFALYAEGTVLDVKFGIAADSTTGVPSGGWNPVTGQTSDPEYLSGKAIITSVDLNASVSEKASFSLTLTGKGPIAIA